MTGQQKVHWCAFEGYLRLASGAPVDVARAVKSRVDSGPVAPLLVFDGLSGQQVDIDLRGSAEDVERWVARVVGHIPVPMPAVTIDSVDSGVSKGPGRRKLGVVGREVTLLPRHWEWLSGQPGGASAALRKLVDEARVRFAHRDRVRETQERTYRFMAAMCGNLPGFEDASRALFASDDLSFSSHIQGWPSDVRRFVEELASHGGPLHAV